MMQKTPIISKATINTILCSYCKQKKAVADKSKHGEHLVTSTDQSTV